VLSGRQAGTKAKLEVNHVDKSVVSIAKDTDVQEMVDRALAQLDGIDDLLAPGATVFLKPNAGHPAPPETSVNTNPEVLKAVVAAVKRYKPKEIIMAEASAVGQDTLKALELAGLRAAAEEAGVDRIVDIKRLDKDETVEVEVPNPVEITKFRVPKMMLEADCVIGLPIFKTHLSMVFTGAVKAMKGVVDDRTHRKMHFVDLSEALFDLLSVTQPDLSIVDMVRPQEGLGPMTLGKPVDFGCIVAGTDALAIDATACRMTGIDLYKTYLTKGAKRGIGVIDEDQIEVRGNSIAEVYKKLDTPYLEGFSRYSGYDIYDENSCSSCMGVMMYVLEALKTQGKYEENQGISLVFGPKKELPEGCARGKDLILVGKCVERFRDQGVFVGGCPPMAFGPVFAILKRTDQEEEQAPVDAWKDADAEDWLKATEGKH
jgi:uncharacterized protein (DUF362 family)